MAAVRLTDAMLQRMLKDAAFRQAMPFLQDPPRLVAKSGRGCGNCSRRRNNGQPPVDFDALRKRILSMDDANKATVKRFLRADSLQVRWRDNGKVRDTVI